MYISKKKTHKINFWTVIKNKVTLAGAPTYTSGIQKWKGATPNFKNNAINIKKTPNVILNSASKRAINSINLEKSNADLKYFSKIIAHDLNHPLVTILGYSNIILKANKKKLNEDEMRKLQTIINDSTEMSDTINLLLQNSFPRLERDQVNLGK